MATEVTVLRRIVAAAIHCYTAAGGVAAIAALVEASNRQFRTAFLLLFVAALIDYTDGTLARAIGAKRMLPEIDGTMIDSLVDFVSNIVAPIILLIHASLWPGPVWLWVAIAIVPSLYRFALNNPHRSAGFFLGAPPMWTFQMFYIYELRLPPLGVELIAALYFLLCFIPFGYVHISRFRRHALQHTVALAVWWAIYLVVTQQWTSHGRTLTLVSLIYFIYYAATSAYHYRVYLRGIHGAVPSNSVEMKS
jgi:phosphatidylcholine synthase